MKVKGTLILFVISFFTALLTFVFLTTSVFAAISSSDFADGISGWQSNPTNRIGSIDIGTNSTTNSNLSLGYAFGLAQNKDGKVKPMSDDSIIKQSEATGSNNIKFSKMNVFLNSNSNYISSVFQGGHKSNSGTDNQENVSLTSPDFLLVPSDSKKAITAKNFSILGAGLKNVGNTGNPGLTDKKFYYAQLPSGEYAYKIVGNFTRTDAGEHNGSFNLEVELLLRPSPTNSAIVQRELYVKNIGTSATIPFTILFGEDTQLGASDNAADNDRVPINNLGNANGIYIEDLYNNYKLMVTNLTTDGFVSYSGQTYDSNGMNWAKGFFGQNINGKGAEYGFKNDNLLGKGISGDTSYTLKWASKTLAKNEVAHFGSTIGVTAKPFAIPTPQKSFINESRNDGTNMVGDTLKFKLNITNNGYGSKWNFKKIVDKLPTGLKVDAKSLRLNNNGGTTQVIDSSNYDNTTNTITVAPALTLTDTQYATLTFEAQITNDAIGSNNLTNTADFIGIDVGNHETDTKTYPASTNIMVTPPNYYYHFSKLVKKHSDTNFQQSIDVKKDDIVDYQIIYSVDANSKDTLKHAEYIDDKLPDGIKLDNQSIKIWGPKNSESDFYPQTHINTGNINSTEKGERVKIQFSAKVTSSAIGKITNNAFISSVQTTGNELFDNQISTDDDIKVQNINSILDIPKLIDFGATNISNHEKLLKNASTEGQLIITHPNTNPYNVCVAYDNPNIFPTLPSAQLFIRQRTKNSEDLGKWVPISSSGTPLKTDNFDIYDSNIDLTSYIGAGDWKLKLAANTPIGYYKATLTWGLTESI